MAEKHTIESGDSYWDIAKKKWGGDDNTINENRKRLQELNGGKALYAGDTIKLDDTPDGPVSSSKPEPKGIAPKTGVKPGANGPDGKRKPMLPPKSTSGQGGDRFKPKPTPKKTGPGIKPPTGLFKTPPEIPLKGMPSKSTQGQGGDRFAPSPKKQTSAPSTPSRKEDEAKIAARKAALNAASSPDNSRKPVAGKPTLKAPVSPRRDSAVSGKGMFSLPKSSSGSFNIEKKK